jgi:hypothetical protein
MERRRWRSSNRNCFVKTINILSTYLSHTQQQSFLSKSSCPPTPNSLPRPAMPPPPPLLLPQLPTPLVAPALEPALNTARQNLNPTTRTSTAPQAPPGIPFPSQAPQFGAPAAPQFGAPAAPQFGAPAAPLFGAPAAPLFGAPAAPLFGAPAAPLFGAPAASQFWCPGTASVWRSRCSSGPRCVAGRIVAPAAPTQCHRLRAYRSQPRAAASLVVPPVAAATGGPAGHNVRFLRPAAHSARCRCRGPHGPTIAR